LTNILALPPRAHLAVPTTSTLPNRAAITNLASSSSSSSSFLGLIKKYFSGLDLVRQRPERRRTAMGKGDWDIRRIADPHEHEEEVQNTLSGSGRTKGRK